MTAHTLSLEDWEYQWAVHVGLARDAVNAGRGDAKHYDSRRMEDNKRASIAAACAEMAVAKATRRYWSGSVWPIQRHGEFEELPDVEPNIEVRRTRSVNGDLPVRVGDVERSRTMFLAFPDPDTNFQRVIIIGWCKATDVWDVTKPAPYDPSGRSRLLDQEHLLTEPPTGGWGGRDTLK